MRGESARSTMTLCSDRPDILDTLSDRDLMTADRDGMEDMSGKYHVL